MKKLFFSLLAAVMVMTASAHVTNNVITGELNEIQPAIKLLRFSASVENNKVKLNWAVSSNETTDRFEVERSADNVNFKTAALVFTSETSGDESYKYFETPSINGKVFYRLKIFEKDQTVSYSKVIVLQASTPDK